VAQAGIVVTIPTFTCVVPAYNEGARIGGVLTAINRHPDLHQVIVIDDGSTDDTAAVAARHEVTVLRTPGNLGKTAALAFGLGHVTSTHVLLLDADLIGLTAEDVTRLVEPVKEGRALSSVSLRGNAPRLWRLIGLDYISGERALPMDLLQPHVATFNTLPKFGFEVFLNGLLIAQKRPIAVVRWPHVASPSKASKQGLWRGLWSDARMMGDIFRTITPVEALRQIVRMRHLRAR